MYVLVCHLSVLLRRAQYWCWGLSVIIDRVRFGSDGVRFRLDGLLRSSPSSTVLDVLPLHAKLNSCTAAATPAAESTK